MLTTNYIKEIQAVVNNYNNLLIAKENLTDKLIEHSSKMESAKGQNMSGMPSGSGGAEDKMLNMFFEKEAIMEQLDKTNYRIEKLEKAFKSLDEKEMDFIRVAFREELPDGVIAQELGITKRHLYRKRKDVIIKIAKIIWGYI